MIASYMDESFDRGNSGVFCVGGLLGRGVPFFELERKWEILRKRLNIAHFKASHCERGIGEFAKFVGDSKKLTLQERQRLSSISHDFLRLISRQEGLIVQGIGIVQADFYDVIQDPRARSILGNDPYRLAYDLAMIQCAWTMKELGTGDLVAFVCDEHEKYGPVAQEAYRRLILENPGAARHMGTFSSGDDRECEPLQAADAAIFEIRRALNVVLGHWEEHLRRQFDILATAGKVFLIQHTDKQHLLNIVTTHDPGEPFKLDLIMGQRFDGDIKFRI